MIMPSCILWLDLAPARLVQVEGFDDAILDGLPGPEEVQPDPVPVRPDV